MAKTAKKAADGHAKQQLNVRISEEAHERLQRLMERDGDSKVGVVERGLKALELVNEEDLPGALRRAAAIVEAHQRAKAKFSKKSDK